MYNKLFRFLLIFAGLSFAGCSKFLDRKPISSLSEDNYYSNTSEVETGVWGAYSALRDVYANDPVIAGLRSDDAYVSESEGDINQIDGFGETTTNSYVATYWQTSYFAVKQCNTVLKYINNVTDSTKKQWFEGEAKFMRALLYFNMVRIWGDVPLVTSSIDYTSSVAYTRVNVNDVYAQIVNDLNEAIQKLPESWTATENARATNRAAKGLLAKVYLTQKKYTEARTLLLDLLQNPGQYKLLSDYTQIFGVPNEGNNEIMFAVKYKSYANGLGNNFTYWMDNFPGSPGFKASSDFRGNTPFPEADSIRKYQTFIRRKSTTGSTSYYCGGKYSEPGAPKYDGGTDLIVLRYADIIAMYAEVVNEIDGDTPLDPTDASNPLSRLYQLNLLRSRAAGPIPANVPVYLYTDSKVSSKDEFRKTLKAERRREFGEEDQRWFDLVRWGDAVTVMNAHFAGRGILITIQDYQKLYPIPQREIDLSQNRLTQNPGYF